VSLAVDHETVMEPDPRAEHNLLLIHAEVADKDGLPRYRTEFGGAVVPESAIRPEEWTYVALGHHHIAEPLAANAWYAGGIERTSNFIWQEKAAKGFLVYDTNKGQATFEAVETRPILDLPWVEARGLSAAEVDEQVRGRVESIPGGIEGKMVRLVVADVTRHVVREMNHRRIREWKAEALHFHLDARPPEVRRRVASGAPVLRQTLREQVKSFLANTWKPSRQGIESARLVELGVEFIDRAGEEG
jgi:DNA repair exonuclease SbcCD nuclease subunit